jgi:glutamate-5-semialdehyde dehydrogenase
MSLENLFKSVQQASRSLALIDDKKVNNVLLELADLAEKEIPFLLEENQKDLVRMEESNPKYDRLMLTDQRIKDIASDIRNVANLESPVGKTLSEKKIENGLVISKVTVPLGVIGIIYESRPNVTFDVFSLCLKSGNATLLKGSRDAEYSNLAVLKLIHQILNNQGIDANVVQLLPVDREATTEMLNAVNYVDIIIPRGSQGLINFVRENSKVPVIETGAGIVHTYVDEFADKTKAISIVVNAKTRRVSVCNALDCLVIHKNRLTDLPDIGKKLYQENVEIYADEAAYQMLEDNYPTELLKRANDDSFGTEFLDYKLSIKTVGSINEAIDHITLYSSKHSESIVSENPDNINIFLKTVDAAAVYANASTAFTDGSQFGLGAEIGISTQKLHARGPMALEELCSYKWIIVGTGQTRN